MKKAPQKPVKGKSVARYIHHWLKSEVVRLSWGKSEYDYYLDGMKLLNKYLWLRRKAGENKAGVWLKKMHQDAKSVDKL